MTWRVRKKLKRLLQAHLEIEVVGERRCADDALEAIENFVARSSLPRHPMPGRNGFDLLAKIPDLPQVIFNDRRRDRAANCLTIRSGVL
jgi:two-component system, LytTR family, response regulator